MTDLRNLQELAGIHISSPVQESLEQHRYVFLVVDPTTGEYTEYYRGSPIEILKQLERDPENSMLADILKKRSFGDATAEGGNLSFKFDDHIFMFVPLNA